LWEAKALAKVTTISFFTLKTRTTEIRKVNALNEQSS